MKRHFGVVLDFVDAVPEMPLDFDGACDEKGALASFTLRPHLYQRRGFWLAVSVVVAALAASAYRLRIRQLRAREKELQQRVDEALARIQVLDGMLPICAGCKKIRDDTGYWNQMEIYVREHSQAEFSHSICPDCMLRLYPQYVVGKDHGPGAGGSGTGGSGSA